ncbi:MAG TPA: DUF748 domain-containing protein [Myxococcota bacterium]|nr:DUF748 domain-containing protein [Myxococcota bacterium]
MKLPDREAITRSLRVRRNQIWLAVLIVLVALRIALPYVLRPIIVKQADEALVGRIALRDLDLSLVRGGVTLHGLEVYADELPPPGSPPVPEPKPPLFAAERLWVQISWFELLIKTIEVKDFALEDFVVRLDRLKDGLVLPKPVPSAEPEPATKPEEKPSSPWGFAADAIALRRGQVTFRDFTVGETPQRFDLAIPNFGARQLKLRFDPSGGKPGHVAIEVDLGGGKIGYEADVETKPAGPALHSKIKLANLPIGGVRVYLKMFGWSALEGLLDAEIDHRFETGGAHEFSGTGALKEVVVHVPKLDVPALRFDKLAVAIDKIDLIAQHAAVSEVSLSGAHVVVDPRAKPQLPVLQPPSAAMAPAAEALPAPTPGPPAKPWTWSLGRARLVGSEVALLGAAGPLSLLVDSEVRSVAQPTTGSSPVSLSLREGGGELHVDGDLTLEPLGFRGKIAVKDLALGPLAARAAAPGADLLRSASARADLELGLAPRGAAAPGAADLRVAGSLGLAGLEVGRAGDKDFDLKWKDLAIEVREATVQPALGGDAAQPRAVAVAVQNVELLEPAVVLTRTPKGFALPPIGAPAPAPEQAGAAPQPAPAVAAAPPPEIKLDLERFKVRRGRATVADQVTTPYFDARIEQLDALVQKLHWPPAEVGSFVVDLKGLHGAVLHVKGGLGKSRSKVTAELTGLPLAPFNPYVTPSGYSLSNGALSLESETRLEGDSYDSTTDLKVDDLELGGAEGEALFEENFGIPLSMAIGLLKDTSGVISLSVPVAGDRSGAHVGLGSLVGQALRKALVGALASPLKLLGVGASGDKVDLKPEPVEFLPGSAEPSDAGSARIDKIAELLAAAPAISLTLHGGSSASDERALRERALLDELEQTTGFRALGHVGELRVRRAVRLYLQAKAAGETPKELDPDQSAWLEQKIPSEPLAAGVLDELAQKRAAALADKLVSGHGVGADRVGVGESLPAGTLPVPGVAVALGTRTAH